MGFEIRDKGGRLCLASGDEASPFLTGSEARGAGEVATVARGAGGGYHF